MEKFYELSDITKEYEGVTLYRIRALQEISNRDGDDVKVGDLGGWVQSEDNLRQSEESWIFDDAMAYGNSRVLGALFDRCEVSGNAYIGADTALYDDVQISGNAHIDICDFDQSFSDSIEIKGNVKIGDNVQIKCNGLIEGDVVIKDNVKITSVYESIHISGHALLCDNVCITLDGHTCDVACDISGFTQVSGNVQIGDGVTLLDNCDIGDDVCLNATRCKYLEDSDDSGMSYNQCVIPKIKVADSVNIKGAVNVGQFVKSSIVTDYEQAQCFNGVTLIYNQEILDQYVDHQLKLIMLGKSDALCANIESEDVQSDCEYED